MALTVLRLLVDWPSGVRVGVNVTIAVARWCSSEIARWGWCKATGLARMLARC